MKVGRLDAAQRGRVLRALALAEAGALIVCPPSDDVPPNEATDQDAPMPPMVAEVASAEAGLLVTIGRGRIENFGCPHCSSAEVRPWGSASGRSRYRCAECHKTFNLPTGTPLLGLDYQDRWRDQAEALIAGETVSRAAKRCGVTYTTAFHWRHHFLAALNLYKPQSLSGIVEVDETFILESLKGKRGRLSHFARKRGSKASKRALSAEQTPIVVARDRNGATIDAVPLRLDVAGMTGALGHVITTGAVLCCDGGKAIRGFARRARVKTHVLDAPGNPKPGASQFHINNANAYHSRLKEWMRRFHGIATDLPNYLSWRRAIKALSNAFQPDAWIMGAAGLGSYQQRSP